RIYKVPGGLALGSLLIGAGLQHTAALGWVATVEATTLLGRLIGIFFLGKVSTFWLGLIMAHVGGGFLYRPRTLSSEKRLSMTKNLC
ncbi:MAG: hypothetical protein J2P56_04650, partial [Verrucomicrobia bacterium]|nr:hypothetical protein [Verrucomicrobiota bacterium]